MVTATEVTAEQAGGSQIGKEAAELLGFWGATPIVQPVGAAQAAVTDNSGGTAAPTTGVVANSYKQTFIIPVQLADLVNSGVWKVAVPFAFTLLSALFRTGKPASTAAKAATLTCTVGGAAVTGGVMSLTSANQNTTGGSAAATAISGAGATGAAGATLEFTPTSVTAFVEGDGYVEFTVSNNDLANAAATIIALENALRSGLVSAGLLKGAA